MNKCIWFFGRGASVAYGLAIEDSIRAEMDKPYVNTAPYRELLSHLASYTKENWRHVFFTTNC